MSVDGSRPAGRMRGQARYAGCLRALKRAHRSDLENMSWHRGNRYGIVNSLHPDLVHIMGASDPHARHWGAASHPFKFTFDRLDPLPAHSTRLLTADPLYLYRLDGDCRVLFPTPNSPQRTLSIQAYSQTSPYPPALSDHPPLRRDPQPSADDPPAFVHKIVPTRRALW